MKISALKITKKPVPIEESSSSSSSSERDNSSSDEEADKSSDASQGSRTPVRKHVPDTSHGNRTPVRKHLPEPEQPTPTRALRETKPRETPTKDEEAGKKKVTVVESKVETKPARPPEEKPARGANTTKLVKEEPRPVRGSARLENLRSEPKTVKSPVKVNSRTSDTTKSGQSKTVSPAKSGEKPSPSGKANTSRLRSYRRKPVRGQQEKTPTKVGCSSIMLTVEVLTL